jgi:hypothetical protein
VSATIVTFVVISGLAQVWGNVAPIALAWRRRYCPVVMTWTVWTVLTTVGAVGSARAHDLPAASYSAICGAGCALVAVAALRTPAARRDPPVRLGWLLWNDTPVRLDAACWPPAVAGIILLLVVRSPAPAIAIAVATDAIAFIPTFAHAMSRPGAEPWQGYARFAVGAWLSLVAVGLQHRLLSVPAVAYPAYLAVADTAITAMILRSRVAAIRPRPEPTRF